MIQTLRHFRRSEREHRGLVVVAVCVERIHAEMLPEPAIHLVFLRIEGREINQHGYRAAGDGPSPYPHAQSVGLGLPFPAAEQRVVFRKVRIFLAVGKIGTDEDHPVLHLRLQGLGPRREHRVNSADFIADFPARFKNIVGKHRFLIHDVIL